MNCCICDEAFKPGDKVAVNPDGRVAVHDPRCTFLVPHHYLSTAEQEEVRRLTVLAILPGRFKQVQYALNLGGN